MRILNPLFNKNQRWLLGFGETKNEWKQLLWAVYCFHGLINDCWIFYVHSVSLIVNINFNCEDFFIRNKTISHSAVPAFKSLGKIFALTSLFCFWTGLRSLSHLVGNIFDDSSDWGHISAICLAYLFGFLYALSWTVLIIFFDQTVGGFSLLGQFSDVPSSLSLFTT